jgi:hypothetical protein
MEPLLICLASASAVWISAITVSESTTPGRVSRLAEHFTEAVWRLRWLRFVIAPLTAVWPLLLLLAASGRAIFATMAVLAGLIGLAFANRSKIKLLREPVVSFDFAFFSQILANPGLYIPFVGTWRVVGLVFVAVSVPTAALLLEPSFWVGDSRVLGWTRAALFMASAVAIAGWPVLVRALFPPARLDQIGFRGEPMRELARFGLLGSWLLQYASGRNEEELERIRSYRPELPPPMRSGRDAPHIVVVQAESFFDVRRLFARANEDPPVTLPNFERICAMSLVSGRLEVWPWGANSLRTEFEVLSMIPETELGVHCFNPYLRLARRPVWTFVQHLRSLGYRTICVHPFSKRFFRRDRVYGNLGFDEFIDIAAFADAPRCGSYVCDRAIAGMVGKVLTASAEVRPIFVFAITMEAHGPWPRRQNGNENSAHLPSLPSSIASSELAHYLYHLQHTDQLIGDLMHLTRTLRRETVLGLYGDHLPMLAKTYERAGFDETATDYAIWRSGPPARASKRAALAPEDFGREVLAAAELIDQQEEMPDQAILRSRG